MNRDSGGKERKREKDKMLHESHVREEGLRTTHYFTSGLQLLLD